MWILPRVSMYMKYSSYYQGTFPDLSALLDQGSVEVNALFESNFQYQFSDCGRFMTHSSILPIPRYAIPFDILGYRKRKPSLCLCVELVVLYGIDDQDLPEIILRNLGSL